MSKALDQGQRMNKQERRVLCGIYYANPTAGQKIKLLPIELYWLIEKEKTPYAEWRGDEGAFKTAEVDCKDFLSSMGKAEYEIEKCLSFLQSYDLLQFEKDGDHFAIVITGSGISKARKLSTCWGRLDVLYRENKDGVLWLIATILVSMITSYVVGK